MAKFSRPQKKTRIVGAKIIIVCEGDTEEIYFEAIRKSKKLQTLQINVVNPAYSDPANIVKTAVELRDAAKKDDSWTQGDEAWAIFDGEEHMLNNMENWRNALNLAARKNINLGISNPSVELWYLLHFQDQTANINRSAVIKRLKKHIPAYDKPKNFYESHFKLLTAEASARAEILSRRIEQDNLDKFNNPSTQIHLLVKKLSEL